MGGQRSDGKFAAFLGIKVYLTAHAILLATEKRACNSLVTSHTAEF